MKKKATVLLMALLLIALMIGMIACDPGKTTEKQDAVITVNEKSLLAVYNGKEHSVEATLNHKEAQLSYSPQQGYTEAGEYKITISAPETDNYKAVSKEVTLVIKKAKAGELVVFPDWNAKIPFDGAPHKVNAMVAGREDAVITYDPEIANTTGYTEVGDYSVKITVAADNNYEEVVETLTFSIVPKHGEVYDEFKQALADNFTSAQDGTSVSFSTVFSLKQGDQAQSAVLDFKANFKDDVIASTMAVTISQDDALVLGLYLKDGKFYLERPNGDNVWTDASTLLPLIEQINVDIPADTITMIETMLKQYLFAAANSAIHNTVTGEFEFNLDLAWIYDNLYDDLGSIIAPFIDKVLTYQVTDKEGVVSTKYVFEFTDGKGNVVGLSSANLGEFLRVSDLGASMNAKFTDGALNASLTAKGFGTELEIELKDLKVSGTPVEIADLDEKTNVENYTQIKPLNISANAEMTFGDKDGKTLGTYDINLRANLDPSVLVGKDLKTQWPSALKEIGMLSLTIKQQGTNQSLLTLVYDPTNSVQNNLFFEFYSQGLDIAINATFNLDDLYDYMIFANGQTVTPAALADGDMDINTILETVGKVLRVLIPNVSADNGSVTIQTQMIKDLLDVLIPGGLGIDIDLGVLLFGAGTAQVTVKGNSFVYGDVTLDQYNAFENDVKEYGLGQTTVINPKAVNKIVSLSEDYQTTVMKGTDLLTKMNKEPYRFNVEFTDGTTGRNVPYVVGLENYDANVAGTRTVTVYMIPAIGGFIETALFEMLGLPLGLMKTTIDVTVVDYEDPAQVTVTANSKFNIGDDLVKVLNGKITAVSDPEVSMSITKDMLNLSECDFVDDKGIITGVGSFTVVLTLGATTKELKVNVSGIECDTLEIIQNQDILSTLNATLSVYDESDESLHVGVPTQVRSATDKGDENSIVDGKFNLDMTFEAKLNHKVILSFVDPENGKSYEYTVDLTVLHAKNWGNFYDGAQDIIGTMDLGNVVNLSYLGEDDVLVHYNQMVFEEGKFYLQTLDGKQRVEIAIRITKFGTEEDVTSTILDMKTGKVIQPEKDSKLNEYQFHVSLVSNPEIKFTKAMFKVVRFLDLEGYIVADKELNSGSDLYMCAYFYLDNVGYYLTWKDGAYKMVAYREEDIPVNVTLTDESGQEIKIGDDGKITYSGVMHVKVDVLIGNDSYPLEGDITMKEPPKTVTIKNNTLNFNDNVGNGIISLMIDVKDGKGEVEYRLYYENGAWVLKSHDDAADTWVTDTRFTIGDLLNDGTFAPIEQALVVSKANKWDTIKGLYFNGGIQYKANAEAKSETLKITGATDTDGMILPVKIVWERIYVSSDLTEGMSLSGNLFFVKDEVTYVLKYEDKTWKVYNNDTGELSDLALMDLGGAQMIDHSSQLTIIDDSPLVVGKKPYQIGFYLSDGSSIGDGYVTFNVAQAPVSISIKEGIKAGESMSGNVFLSARGITYMLKYEDGAWTNYTADGTTKVGNLVVAVFVDMIGGGIATDSALTAGYKMYVLQGVTIDGTPVTIPNDGELSFTVAE